MRDPKNPMTSNDVFSFMKNNFISRIVVTFSGGGDEGHVESTSFFGRDGAPIDYKFPPSCPSYGWHKDKDGNKVEAEWVTLDGHVDEERDNGTTWKRGVYRAATDYETRMAQLAGMIEKPIFDRYGSFAGEFSVYGDCTWIFDTDTDQGFVQMSGDESTMEGFEYEVEA